MKGHLIGITVQYVFLFAAGLWFLLAGADVAANPGPLATFLVMVLFFSSWVVSLVWMLHSRIQALEKRMADQL